MLVLLLQLPSHSFALFAADPTGRKLNAVPSHARPALVTSMSTGLFIDCQFLLYTRRRNSGEVHTPCAVYANSTALKAGSDHFRSRELPSLHPRQRRD